MEGENPTRRYKWFRPRQAYRGYGASVGGADVQSVSLYNNLKSTHVLVVRAFAGAVQTFAMVTETRQNVLGSLAMNGVPLLSGEAAGFGQVFTNTGETALAPDYFLPIDGDQGWNHDFPFEVLQPNWSLHVQPGPVGNNGDIRVSFLWEAILIDELDFLFW